MFTMSFTFEEMEPETTDRINEALSGLLLSDIDIAGEKGYAAKSIIRDPETGQRKETYRYGFMELALCCKNDEADGLHTWQVDAQVVPKGTYVDSNEFHDAWCDQHPDRVMRLLIARVYNKMDSFVVFYHERPAKPKAVAEEQGRTSGEELPEA